MFAALDGRWVVRNITLDGNTYRSSHSVDRREFVADLSYGFTVRKGAWKLSMSRFHRTREFRQQDQRAVFGSFAVSRDI